MSLQAQGHQGLQAPPKPGMGGADFRASSRDRLCRHLGARRGLRSRGGNVSVCLSSSVCGNELWQPWEPENEVCWICASGRKQGAPTSRKPEGPLTWVLNKPMSTERLVCRRECPIFS